MPRTLRYLRMAFSAFCGMCCVLAIVLWVRSYWRYDSFSAIYGASTFDISSNYGELHWFTTELGNPARTNWQLIVQPARPSGLYIETKAISVQHAWGITWGTFGNGAQAGVHIWLVVLGCLILAGVPWVPLHRIPQRFSLRTLLIGTTIVAVGLGLIVWMM
jgi:hypothetical protein